MRLRTATTLLNSTIVWVLLAQPATAELPRYHVQDLGTLGGQFTEPADINNNGEVTGSSATADGAVHAFMYVDGEMRDLGSLGGLESAGHAINDLGQITGAADTAGGAYHTFFYAAGLMTDLGVLAAPHNFPGAYSSGNDINTRGEVAGLAAFTPAGEYHAVRYSAGTVQDLGVPGELYSRGDAINDAGEVAGIFAINDESHAFLYSNGIRIDLVPGHASYVSGKRMLNNAGHVTGSFSIGETSHGFVYRDGLAIDIGTLGGDFSSGEAINSAGKVTGFAATADGEAHAFIYSAGTMNDLGTLGGEFGNFSIGYAINDSDQVTGFAAASSGENHAFVYADGRMIDLQPQIAALRVGEVYESIGYDINQRGQVLGVFYVLSDPFDPLDPLRSRGFIATPVSSLFDSLLKEVRAVGLGNSLANKLQRATAYYDAQDKRATCAMAGAFVREVNAQTGKKLEQQLVARLLEAAREINVAIGCP